MILKVDHVAFSGLVRDRAKISRELIDEGFEMSVCEKELMNLPLKSMFLSSYSSVHDLALYRKDGCVSVEILDHHTCSGRNGYLQPAGENVFHCRTCSLDGSVRFWSRLGFSLYENTHLRFFSPMGNGNGIELKLRVEKSPRQSMLDDLGFNAVALICTDLESCARNLEDVAEVSEISSLHVGDKDLKIFFARNADGGELVEMIEWEFEKK